MLERSWVGRRVTVRRVVDRSSDGRPLFGDVVGDLASMSAQTALVRTRAGLVEVARTHIVVAKLVPPSTAEELALDAVMARGWRPEQTGAVGGWVLRASSGCTGRGNSVLPVRPPGLPLDEALDAARDWYAERDLPVRVQVPLDARRLLDAGLAERGWVASPDVDVLAARLDALPCAAVAGEPAVHVDGAPGEDWLARYRDGVGLQPAARGLLTRHDRAGFASILDGGRVVAIGRGAVDDAWLGITAIEVAPALRRQGLAQAILRALWRWGSTQGAERSHLEVSSDNPAGLALYERLGYWRHHGYRFRDDPTG